MDFITRAASARKVLGSGQHVVACGYKINVTLPLLLEKVSQISTRSELWSTKDVFA